jgi:hypothetical protein
MKITAPVHWLWIAGIVLGTLVFTHSFARHCISALGTALGDLPEAALQLNRAREREQELDAQIRALLARIAARRRITQDVIADRLSLAEAASRLQTLYQSCPRYQRQAERFLRQGMSAEEYACRAVIASVRTELLHEPQQAQRILSRLEAELARMRQSHVPTPPASLPAFSSGFQGLLSGLSRLRC